VWPRVDGGLGWSARRAVNLERSGRSIWANRAFLTLGLELRLMEANGGE